MGDWESNNGGGASGLAFDDVLSAYGLESKSDDDDNDNNDSGGSSSSSSSSNNPKRRKVNSDSEILNDTKSNNNNAAAASESESKQQQRSRKSYEELELDSNFQDPIAGDWDWHKEVRGYENAYKRYLKQEIQNDSPSLTYGKGQGKIVNPQLCAMCDLVDQQNRNNDKIKELNDKWMKHRYTREFRALCQDMADHYEEEVRDDIILFSGIADDKVSVMPPCFFMRHIIKHDKSHDNTRFLSEIILTRGMRIAGQLSIIKDPATTREYIHAPAMKMFLQMKRQYDTMSARSNGTNNARVAHR